VRKLSSIPEVQSDFIFAVWAEEMGFFGVCLYFALLVGFSVRGYYISLKCRDRFRSYLGFGCTTIILLQSLLNCGVVVRLFPATGMPLPFFSSGGTSLLITLCLCGFILNVSRWKPEGAAEND
jgi:cell division protein FtsW